MEHPREHDASTPTGAATDAARSGAGSRLRLSPFCAHLSSKKILTSTGLPMTDADVLDASNWCWCRETGHQLGPDRAFVHPEDCRAGRACFVSRFRG